MAAAGGQEVRQKGLIVRSCCCCCCSCCCFWLITCCAIAIRFPLSVHMYAILFNYTTSRCCCFFFFFRTSHSRVGTAQRGRERESSVRCKRSQGVGCIGNSASLIVDKRRAILNLLFMIALFFLNEIKIMNCNLLLLLPFFSPLYYNKIKGV